MRVPTGMDRARYDDLRALMRTGDKILCRGRGLVARGIRLVSRGWVNHIGTVIRIDRWPPDFLGVDLGGPRPDLISPAAWDYMRDPEAPGIELYVIESTTRSIGADLISGRRRSGVQIHRLRDFVRQYDGEVFWRGIDAGSGPNEDTKRRIIERARDVYGLPYERSPLELLESAWGWGLDMINTARLGSVFCSELAAELDLAAGWLCSVPDHGICWKRNRPIPSNKFSPADWCVAPREYEFMLRNGAYYIGGRRQVYMRPVVRVTL